ncbi:type II toxin-antitoxin system VapC family toxin [Avibacterium volantium]|uniref:type II toxin-antitoxin system VapC family toxin n=1 Tax=Avibacterium TaxID=292486 RepID=UPI003BF83787
MKKILLDSNRLITAIKDENSPERQALIELLQDDETQVFITPLIRYEVLRGVDWQNEADYQKHEAALSQLDIIQVDQKIADQAAVIFRFERAYRRQNNETPKKIDKHNFDLMYYATAKVYGLEWKSNDSDLQSWENLNLEMQKELNP